MTNSEWITRFVAAMKKWPEAKSFVKSGGVPACQVPQKMSFPQLAEWFLSTTPNPLGEYAWIVNEFNNNLETLAPEILVDFMRSEDNAYSPDY